MTIHLPSCSHWIKTHGQWPKKTLTSVVKNSKHHFKTPNASKLQDIFVFGNLQSRKLTWQWKMDPFEDVFPIEHGDSSQLCQFPRDKKRKCFDKISPQFGIVQGTKPINMARKPRDNCHIGFWWPFWCWKKNTLAILRFRALFGMVVFGFLWPELKGC